MEDSILLRGQLSLNLSTDSIKSQSNPRRIFFVEIDKPILKWVWKFKLLKIHKEIFKEKNNDRRFIWRLPMMPQ